MIVQNAVICNKCDELIYSAHRHDFRECKCGNIAVDGGQEYLRRVGKGIGDGSYTDLSWGIDEKIYRECAEAVQNAADTGRNAIGIANAVMRKLREHQVIVADNEPWIMAQYEEADEIMVVEADGTINRYVKIV